MGDVIDIHAKQPKEPHAVSHSVCVSCFASNVSVYPVELDAQGEVAVHLLPACPSCPGYTLRRVTEDVWQAWRRMRDELELGRGCVEKGHEVVLAAARRGMNTKAMQAFVVGMRAMEPWARGRPM